MRDKNTELIKFFDILIGFYIILKVFGNTFCLYTLCSENSKKENVFVSMDSLLARVRSMVRKYFVLVAEKVDMYLT